MTAWYKCSKLHNISKSIYQKEARHAHLYRNHLAQVDEQLNREPMALPVMKINPDVTDIFGFTFDDFELVGYAPHPHIAAKVAV